MRRIAILLVAFVAVAITVQAACTTKGENSALVTTKIVPGKASGGADGGGGALSCAFSPTDTEIDNVSLAPGSLGNIGVVVDNRLVDPSAQNTILRTNTTDFQPHQV